MEGNIAATYTLIYRFLKQQSQSKAAETIKKAARDFVVLRDDVEHEGPPLEDIVKEWRTRQNTKPGDADPSSEEFESSDDSSSNSEDSSGFESSSEDASGSEDENDTSDSDNSSKGATTKKSPGKRDTSVTLSSVGENAREVTKKAIQIPEKEPTETKNKRSASDGSDSDTSKSSASDSSDAETTSSSDSSDEDGADKKVAPNTAKTTENENSGRSNSGSELDDESDSGSQREDAHVAKKRRTSENGAVVTTGLQQTTGASQKKKNPHPKADIRERFQRVKVQHLEPELLLNNGYEAKGGAANDYGERAHRDLIVTRGAVFRKEKNKKKRGSYRGGEITMENHSIKFDF